MPPPRLGGIKLFTADPLAGGCGPLQALTGSQVRSPVIPSCPPGEVPVMVGWHLPSLPDLPSPSLTAFLFFLKDKGLVRPPSFSCPTPTSSRTKLGPLWSLVSSFSLPCPAFLILGPAPAEGACRRQGGTWCAGDSKGLSGCQKPPSRVSIPATLPGPHLASWAHLPGKARYFPSVRDSSPHKREEQSFDFSPKRGSNTCSRY